MKPNNNNSNKDSEQQKHEYQQILKKIEAQSKQKKQQRTLNIMRGQTIKNTSYKPRDPFGAFKKYLNGWRVDLTRYFTTKQNRHTAIMTIFLIFSSYIAWSIQRKYDTLKKKAQRTQTFKQRQVQKENEYIEKMLKKKEFESVPIPSELDEENTYKFQEGGKRGGLVIDTKQDMIDLIKKDNVKTDRRTAEQIYEEEVKRMRERV